MSELFLASDQHLGHRGILKYEPASRPFSCVEEMNEGIIDSHNSVVGKNDIVIFGGDVAFGARNLELVGRMNGIKKLILGNHDLYSIETYLKYFTKVYGAYQLQNFIITHVPVHPCQMDKRFWGNIHGHMHNQKFDRMGKRYINICIDNLPDLKPIPYDEVLNLATEQEEV